MTDLTARISKRLGARVEAGAEAARGVASDPVKSPRTAVVIGRLLGLAFIICFLTGLWSHVLQHPADWLVLPTRPISLYRVTQGLHIISGTAAVPLLLAKLWTVFPRLFVWPPVRSVLDGLERASIAILVSVSLIEVTIGLLNIVQWYVFPFSFRTTHFALAWVAIGALVVHIGVKLPLIVTWWSRRSVQRGTDETTTDATDTDAGVVSRRGFVGAVWVATGAAVLLTAGQSVPALAPLNALAPRRQGVGPQRLPINRTAMEAGVIATAKSPEWSLTIAAPDGNRTFTLADLRAMNQVEAVLPIACVEGWSQSATWRGVRMRDLLHTVGVRPRHPLVIRSLQTRGAFATTEMPPEYALDPLTLIALEVNGEVLDIDHGYPARVIAPGRPGVMQTKWLDTIEVTA